MSLSLSVRDAKSLFARSHNGRKTFNETLKDDNGLIGFQLVPVFSKNVHISGGAEAWDTAVQPQQPKTAYTERYSSYNVLPMSISRENLIYDTNNNSGIYFISPIIGCPLLPANTKHSKLSVPKDTKIQNNDISRLVKIGMAKSLPHRINSYLLSYPDGIFMYGFISTSNAINARLVEMFAHNHFKKQGKRYRDGIHIQDDPLPSTTSTRTHSHTFKTHTHYDEWFVLTANEINTFLKRMYIKRNRVNDVKKFCTWIRTETDAGKLTTTTIKHIKKLETNINKKKFIKKVKNYFNNGYGYYKAHSTSKKIPNSKLQFPEPIKKTYEALPEYLYSKNPQKQLSFSPVSTHTVTL